MVSKSYSTSVVPLGVAAATLTAATLLYSKQKKKANPPSLITAPRKCGRTAYIHIPTTNLAKTASFFAAFGMEELTTSDNDKHRIFACPNSNTPKAHQPYVLLEQVAKTDQSTCASDAGCIGRLCLAVQDVYQTVESLKAVHQVEPIAPPVCDQPGMQGPDNQETKVVIVAYSDVASGAMLELVSLDMTSTVTKVAVQTASTLLSIKFPLFVHANVNATNYSRSLVAYQALGYSDTAKDYGKIQNNLYKALEIKDPGIATYVALIKTPEETMFALDLIEWEETNTPARKGDQQTMMKFSYVVDDLTNEVDRLLQVSDSNGNKLWTLVSSPTICEYPAPLGKALVATLQDPDGLPVDVVEYPNPMVLQEMQLNSAYLGVAATTSKDKVVLVTGCDSGFGRTVACRMALLGFEVVAACYSSEGAKYLKQVTGIHAVVADLGTEAGIQGVVKQTRTLLDSAGNSLWAIVNNAAVCYPGNVDWQSPDKYSHAMQVNFMAPVSLIHELICELKACEGSRIINVSSVCGMLSQPTNSAYCSTKHALESYSDSLRCELLPFGTHVCIVQPATMKTPLGLSYWKNWYKGYLAAPKNRQTSFDEDKLEEFVKKSDKALQDAANDPTITTTAMIKALVQVTPPTRLRTGLAADWFFRPLSQLPDKTRDGLLWNVLGLDSVHTAV